MSLDPCVSLPLDNETLDDTVLKAKHWAIMHGAAMRPKRPDFPPDALVFAPFTLVPSVFPRVEFEKAVALQPLINELMHKIAHDHEFLQQCLKNVIKVDDFTRKLYELYEEVYAAGFTQPISLGLFRSDYLAESTEANNVKQVEVNTISSSFAGISSVVVNLQRYVMTELGHQDKLVDMPTNDALAGLCLAMLEAWKIYNDPRGVIMFVVEDVSYNICDQRFHEFKIREINPNVKVIRRNLTQISKNGKLGPNKELIIDNMTISVVYFRAGYEPGHYHGDAEWQARALIERSLAFKCPSINYHLAGTKKVQQELSKPKMLDRFFSSQEEINLVKRVFTGLYSLDKGTTEGDSNIEMAIRNPVKYVLKPQREGGGNNVYGEDVKKVLEQMRTSDDRSSYILMDRILPPTQKNYLIRAGETKFELQDVVSELGIFGVIIGNKDKIFTNKQVGHMLRTKLSTADEGGVAAGAGALDSPYLI